MIKTIETNKENTMKNRADIKANEQRIQENRVSIDEMKAEIRWHKEGSENRLERIIHKLITLLIIAIALLFITNAIWVYAWNSSGRTMSITNSSNVITGEGSVG